MRFKPENKGLALESTVLYMAFEDSVDELPKETKKGLQNSKTINDVADEAIKTSTISS